MSEIKRCKLYGEIMYVTDLNYAYTTVPDNSYIVQCQKCGATELVVAEVISEEEYNLMIGNHAKCLSCEEKDKIIAELKAENERLKEYEFMYKSLED